MITLPPTEYHNKGLYPEPSWVVVSSLPIYYKKPKRNLRAINLLLVTNILYHGLQEGEFVTCEDYLKPFLSTKQYKFLLK